MLRKLLNGYRFVFTLALVAPEVSAASVEQPASNPPAVTLASLLADSRYTWRKLATLAVKLGITVDSVRNAVMAAGGKFDRTGTLVKVGSLATTAPAPESPAYYDNEHDADDDEDDDFIEGEDDEDGDDSDDSDDYDHDGDYDAAEFNETIMSKLREKLNSPNYRWRKLPTLAQSAGLSESETREYLEHIGAVESRRGGLFRL